MSEEKRDFYGKEVTDAIKKACASFGVSQEQLDIEVLETGTTGIFGLIRKKAKIRARLKQEESENEQQSIPGAIDTQEVVNSTDEESTSSPVEAEESADGDDGDEGDPQEDNGSVGDVRDEVEADAVNVTPEEEVELGEEILELIQSELKNLVELMGYPSSVEISSSGLAVSCSIGGEHEDVLAGPEGKTLDSIQYLLRKVIARKCSERLRITVNVGNFREKRLEELKVRAVELAGQVKENGKTQVLPALNPSERREIHLVLQEDKEVRSRSVGDGLFKKILIYKPGKGNRSGGRKKGPARSRRSRGSKNSKGSSEE